MENKIELADSLFLGKRISKPEKYVKKLNRGKHLKKFYIVTFMNDSHRMEVYSSYMFFQKYFRQQHFLISAIVNDEGEAFEYIRALSEISMKKYGEFDGYRTVIELTKDELLSLSFNMEAEE